jgi:hypothetical protein
MKVIMELAKKGTKNSYYKYAKNIKGRYRHNEEVEDAKRNN